MKSIQLTLLALVGLVSIATAQQKATQKVVINTPSVQCEMCKDRIEKYMSREPGIVSVKVDYKKKTTTVSFLTDRNDIEQVKTAIANVGYDADDINLIPITTLKEYFGGRMSKKTLYLFI